MRNKLMLVLGLLGAVGCAANAAKPHRGGNPSATMRDASVEKTTVAAQSDIRKIDFTNYSYPLTCDIAEFFGPTTNVTLKNGSSPRLADREHPAITVTLEFDSVSYEDVNGNERDEEAIVVLAVEGDGTAMKSAVYIFGLKRGVPEMLWKFDTGDRSHGGLRQVHGANGDLLVERYNNDFVNAGDGSVTSGGACCATTYTRAVYQWTGLEYQLVSAERKPNPVKGASRID
ncbi:MAG: hypothetical protein ABI882_12000 [Acidobacteriota bacterium]